MESAANDTVPRCSRLNTYSNQTCTQTQPLNNLLSGTTHVSRYQKKTFTHSQPWGRRMIRTDNKVHCMGTHTPYGDLSQRGLLDTIKTAYNKSRLDGRLRLTASAFNLLWISMPEVLVTYCYAELSASFIKFLHYCFLSSGFYGAWKDNRTRRNNNRYESHPIWTISAPTSITSLSLCQTPFPPQHSQFILAWDRHQIMLACIPVAWLQ